MRFFNSSIIDNTISLFVGRVLKASLSDQSSSMSSRTSLLFSMCSTVTPILLSGTSFNYKLVSSLHHFLCLRISCFVGLAIEIWKVTKVQDVSFNFENKILGIFPRITLDDKKDYKDSGTKEFDRY